MSNTAEYILSSTLELFLYELDMKALKVGLYALAISETNWAVLAEEIKLLSSSDYRVTLGVDELKRRALEAGFLLEKFVEGGEFILAKLIKPDFTNATSVDVLSETFKLAKIGV